QRIEHGHTLPWGIYHYAGTPDTTWYGFATEIVARGQAAGLLQRTLPVHPITTAEYPTPAPRPRNSRLDCGRLETEFGFQRPQWSRALDDVIMHMNRPATACNP
ncbi:MAG: NAD(P)-dependent oxidoreductase, partial [Nevskiaceae bacterium]